MGYAKAAASQKMLYVGDSAPQLGAPCQETRAVLHFIISSLMERDTWTFEVLM